MTLFMLTDFERLSEKSTAFFRQRMKVTDNQNLLNKERKYVRNVRFIQ